MPETDWLLTIKPTFLNEWMALPAKEVAQIQKKLTQLAEDPTPDAKVKKQLKYMGGKLHRIRSGDYRVFYTFSKPHISVLALRRRDEETYSEDIVEESLGGGEVEPLQVVSEKKWTDWLKPEPAKKKKALPRKITKKWLASLSIDEQYHEALTACASEEDLLDCASVPEEERLRVIDALQERPLELVTQQPDLVVDKTDDLLKYREGELLGFLLRLNPTQERFVTWAKKAKGPTLLKGGPGTGKSTVAIYRARIMLEELKKKGTANPRLLFTTYTNALVEFSRQLLQKLLGDEAECVEVRTADSIARQVVGDELAGFNPADNERLNKILSEAIQTTAFEGNSLQKRAQVMTIDKLGRDYLLEEMLGVIQARGLDSVEAYLETPRPGREVGLNKTQRQAVWKVLERFEDLLEKGRLYTWQQLRDRAAERVEQGETTLRYDGVIIDEAQDLDPCAIRMLVRLCKNPGGLFLTADANQSIYGAGFRWKQVHEWLSFKGRTGKLTANHRSTREIGEAAHDYIQNGVIDEEESERQYVHGGPLPALRAVSGDPDEVELLTRFLPQAAKEFRLGLSSCAVFCPGIKQGDRIAQGLQEAGIKAEYMRSASLNLSKPGVKVMSLKSAKGLEFPVVALAGFTDGSYPHLKHDIVQEAMDEIFKRERRTLFVAMTRAMRALLVVVPENAGSPLLTGFSGHFWNLGDQS